MKQEHIIRNGHDSLLLIFGGWGTWKELFSECRFPEGNDVMLCCDYRSYDFDFSQMEGYRQVNLWAWSMGVWSAAATFDGKSLPWGRRIAVNGTMYPVDDLRGIPVKIFEGTLERMSQPVLDKFRRRMCGSDLDYYLSRNCDRTADELKNELASILSAVKAYGRVPDFVWDLAAVGTDDLIFPVANQRRAWSESGTETKEAEATHYDRKLFDTLISQI